MKEDFKFCLIELLFTTKKNMWCICFIF